MQGWSSGMTRTPCPDRHTDIRAWPSNCRRVAYWPFATFLGIVSIRSLPERSGHSTNRSQLARFMSTHPGSQDRQSEAKPIGMSRRIFGGFVSLNPPDAPDYFAAGAALAGWAAIGRAITAAPTTESFSLVMRHLPSVRASSTSHVPGATTTVPSAFQCHAWT